MPNLHWGIGWLWSGVILTLLVNVASSIIAPLVQSNPRLFLIWTGPSVGGLAVVSVGLLLVARYKQWKRQEKARQDAEEREKEEKCEALRRLFPPLKPAGDVDQSKVLNVRKFNEYNETRPFDEDALTHLKQRRSIILMGIPKMGKARAAWQLIHDNFPDHILLAPVPQTLLIGNVDFPPLKDKEVVILLDDLDRYVDSFDLPAFVAVVKAQSRGCLVVSTLRSGDREQRRVDDKLGSFYGQSEKIALERLGNE